MNNTNTMQTVQAALYVIGRKRRKNNEQNINN